MLGKQFGEQALDGGVERRPLGKLGFQHGGDVVQRAGHGCIQGNICRSDVLGGAEGAEFKLVAGERERAGPVAVGRVLRQRRERIDEKLHRLPLPDLAGRAGSEFVD